MMENASSDVCPQLILPPSLSLLHQEMQDRGRPITPKTLTSVVYALCRATQPRPEEAEALMMELEAGGVAAPDAWTWYVVYLSGDGYNRID